jgi:formylglycine-generating enzyme required for sulfatase activity
MKVKDRGDRRWLVNSQGQTFALIDGSVELLVGLPPFEPYRDANTLEHRRITTHRFAIAVKEVTGEEYLEFVKENPGVDHAGLDGFNPDPIAPKNAVSWFHAVAYCDWLSRKEGLSECYEPNAQGRYAVGMKIRADALRRTGYRLPTEAEWEYACRAGAGTSRYFGVNEGLLGEYAWYLATSQDHAWRGGSLLPNDLGLFDMLGNLHEWCHVDYVNSQGYVDESPRMGRGGAFNSRAAALNSAFRFVNTPSSHSTSTGFRLARTYE